MSNKYLNCPKIVFCKKHLWDITRCNNNKKLDRELSFLGVFINDTNEVTAIYFDFQNN